MTDVKIWQLSAHEVVSLLRSGEVSPLDVVQASIDRIEEVDPKVNAIPIRCFDRAIEKAKKMDIKAEIKNPKSLLGLPIVVKDYNDLAGVKTTYGSKIFKDNIPKKSDATIAKLEENGANPVGKSNVPEWAGGHTFNPNFGMTRNPFNLEKTAGGSSGGSAAALASGQIWLATGNDLGGSLRTPAAFNNVVGLRPSIGVVPRGQRLQPFDTLWVEGPMARSVKDVALMLDAGAGYSLEDPLSFEAHSRSFVDQLEEFSIPGRVAFSQDLGILPVSQEIRSTTEKAILKVRDLGVEITDEIPDFSGVLEGFQTLRGVLLASMMGELVKYHRLEILPDIVKNVELGYKVSNDDIIKAEIVRKRIMLGMVEFFKQTDFLICPTTSVAPFDTDKPFITEIDGVTCETYIDWFAITFALTMTSCPVISLPCGFTDAGLPVGIQIVGKPKQENKLLAFANILEQHFGVSDAVPIKNI
jgi:amidase